MPCSSSQSESRRETTKSIFYGISVSIKRLNLAKTLTTLRALARFYATGSSTSTEFTDADTLVSLNSRYQDSFLLATSADGDFEFNGDGSQSINIVSGTRAYALATDLFKVSRVEIKYPSTSTDYVEANQITGNGMTTGKDSYVADADFDLLGGKIEIFVSDITANIQAVTNGIKVYYQKELTELSAGTDAVIFPDVFARYIAIGAAIAFCGVNGLSTRISWLTNEYQIAESKLIEYVANRNNAKRSSLNFKREDYGNGYSVSDKQI